MDRNRKLADSASKEGFSAMKPGLLGRKIGMTHVLGEGGVMEPVTVIQAGPCTVLQIKTEKTDGYDAIQMGFETVKPHRSTKPMIGHAGKAGSAPKRAIRELRLDAPAECSPGDVFTVEQFTEAKVAFVDVTGTTKGRGFAGVMKRHGFGGQPASRGVERKHRSGGSIAGGASAGTARVIKKGKKMAGHMGDVRCTMSALRLLKVIPEHDLILVRGSVPGANGSLLLIRAALKKG